jgi:hypothetical protein
MTRRAPEAVLAALDMDPMRRELYVEGPTDLHALSWLARDCISDDVVIQDAESIDLPNLDGARDRLVAFADYVKVHERLVVFVDADNEPTVPPSPPAVLVLTDRRDFEGYLLTEACLDKVASVGVGTSALSGAALLAAVLSEARKVGVLRRLSDEQSWRMPFRKTELHPSITASRTAVVVDINRAITRLAGKSIGEDRASDVIALHVEATVRFELVPDHDIVHGKDATAILAEILLKHGVARVDAARIFRMALDRDAIKAYPNLQYVVEFLCA